MSTGNFELCLPWTLAYEGGWSDNPKDPGGATMEGVTQAVYDDWRAAQEEPKQSVKLLTASERDAIYRARYWDRVFGDSLTAGVDYAVFDFAVNSGVARAIKTFQQVLSVKSDGLMGPSTLAACRDYVLLKGPAPLIFALCDARLDFMQDLSTWPIFGVGWQRRVDGVELGAQTTDTGVRDRAFRLAMQQPVPTLAGVTATAKTYYQGPLNATGSAGSHSSTGS